MLENLQNLKTTIGTYLWMVLLETPEPVLYYLASPPSRVGTTSSESSLRQTKDFASFVLCSEMPLLLLSSACMCLII